VPFALPSQEGPLSQYPTYATIDECGKWQRIQDWVAKGKRASVDEAADQPRDVDQIRDVEEDTRSIGASLTELEMMRASHVSGFRPTAPQQSTISRKITSAPKESATHLQTCHQQNGFQQSFDTERRRSDALEIEKLRSRIDILQQSLEGERMLASQAQQQLQAELLHVKSLADSESASRAAEASLERKLDQTKKNLEAEKKRSAEVSRAATASFKEQASCIAALEASKADCEAKLKAERDVKNRQVRQLELAVQNESELRSQIVELEAKRDDQARRLESSCGQIESLRMEIKAMESRQATREEKLLKQVEDVEAYELAGLRKKIEASESALRLEVSNYAVLRECLLCIHHTLSPQQLASAAGYRDDLPSSNQISSEHQAIADRISKNKHVSNEDAQFVSSAVRALLHQSQSVFLHAERRDVAIRAAAEQASDALEAQINTLNARHREAEESFHAQTIELEAALRDVEERLMNEVAAKTSLVARVKDLEEMLREADARHLTLLEETFEFKSIADEGAKDLKASKAQAQEALEAIHAARQEAVDRSLYLQDQVEAKEGRIQELRTALTAASESNEHLAQEADHHRASLLSLHEELSVTKAQLADVQEKADELEKNLISLQQYGVDKDRERSLLERSLSILDREAEESIDIALSSLQNHLLLIKDRPSADDSMTVLLCSLARDIKLSCEQAARSSSSLVPLVPLLSSAVVGIAVKASSFAELAEKSLALACEQLLITTRNLADALGAPQAESSELDAVSKHLHSLASSVASKIVETSSERDSFLSRAEAAEKEVTDLKTAISEEWATLRVEAVRAVEVSEEAAEVAKREAEEALRALNLQCEANEALKARAAEIELGGFTLSA
jgi:chromosome segregation ATPase